MSILIEAADGWIADGKPQTWECPHLVERGLDALFFESVPFKDKPTRVFAWLGVPEGASGDRLVPVVVLVHGGGGTAFARWVRWWNRRGYAAIAMDTRSACLVVSADQGPWPAREWHTLPATIDTQSRQASATVPDGATAAYLSLLSEDWLTTSSRISFSEQAEARQQGRCTVDPGGLPAMGSAGHLDLPAGEDETARLGGGKGRPRPDQSCVGDPHMTKARRSLEPTQGR